MRRLALVVVGLVAATAAAEGVAEREGLGSSAQRVRGAVTLWPASFGFVALGGSSLRTYALRTRQWAPLHQVKGDSVYRVAADERDRVLATWEKDPSVYLFDVKAKTQQRLPKPPCPIAGLQLCSVEDLFFEAGGQTALVYLSGVKSGMQDMTWAYRLPLDGAAPPTLLFAQEGHALVRTRRGAVFALPQRPGKRCAYRDCWPMAGIVAQELVGAGAELKTLLWASGQELSSARAVPGSDEQALALLVALRPNGDGVLRWRFGDAQASWGVLPAPLGIDPTLFLFRGEVAEVRVGQGRALELRRHGVDGSTEPLVLPPLPAGDVDTHADNTIHDVGVRQDGGLWVHWGDSLVLVEPGKPPRRLDLEPLLSRRTEWAGVDVYQPSPEALWLGIEVGAGRDFALLPLADVEKKAKPWGAPPASAR